jgi:hypothetical protein
LSDPVDRAWQLIVNADDDMVPYLAVMSSIESLHRMTREDRNLHGWSCLAAIISQLQPVCRSVPKRGFIGEVYGCRATSSTAKLSLSGLKSVACW